MIRWRVWLFYGALASVAAHAHRSGGSALNSLNVDLRGLAGKRHAVDLTHSLANGDPIFPGQRGFSFDRLGTLDNPDLPLYYGCISFMEHCGTHMDSPAHVVAGGRYLHQLTPPELMAPAIKLDLRAACRDRADYDVTEADVAMFEAAHGRIAAGSVVFLHTGWDARYQDPDAFIVASDDGQFHWPGLSREAATLIAARGVRGVGIDTIGMDGGHVAMTLAAHRALLSSGAFILENVANLAEIPPDGSFVMALPMKVQDGSGAPTRVVAFLD
jgi:kynurenine formamidase